MAVNTKPKPKSRQQAKTATTKKSPKPSTKSKQPRKGTFDDDGTAKDVKYRPLRIEIPKGDRDKLALCVELGVSQEDVATIFGMSLATFKRKLTEDQDLLTCYRIAKAKSNLYVANRLRDHIKAGSLAAVIFYLKAQAGWSERYTVQLTDVDSESYNDKLLNQMNDEELELLYDLLKGVKMRVGDKAES